MRDRNTGATERECPACGQPLTPDGKCPRKLWTIERLRAVLDDDPGRPGATRWEFCGDEQPHERHEFLIGMQRHDCPGAPTLESRIASGAETPDVPVRPSSGASLSDVKYEPCGHRAMTAGEPNPTCPYCGEGTPVPSGASAPRWTREDRIRANHTLLDSLRALWDEYPDMRFGQLVMNVSREPGGFADTWEWGHQTWRERIDKTYYAWKDAHDAD